MLMTEEMFEIHSTIAPNVVCSLSFQSFRKLTIQVTPLYILVFKLMGIFLYMFMCVHHCFCLLSGTSGGQKRVSDHLEL